MAWLLAFFKAILEWLTSEAKKDVKAGDADDIPQSLKNRWRNRINRQLEKQKKQNETPETPESPSDDGPVN